MSISAQRKSAAAAHQGGAVLYVALMMLILLTLIGLVGMQVAGMQERMSSNFRAANIAFQQAEGLVRNAECAIESIENRTAPGACTSITAANIERRCDVQLASGVAFQALAWANARALSEDRAVYVRQIDQCIQGQASLGMGGPVQANPFPVYQVTGYATDEPRGAPTAAEPTGPKLPNTSSAVIDTIFRL